MTMSNKFKLNPECELRFEVKINNNKVTFYFIFYLLFLCIDAD